MILGRWATRPNVDQFPNTCRVAETMGSVRPKIWAREIVQENKAKKGRLWDVIGTFSFFFNVFRMTDIPKNPKRGPPTPPPQFLSSGLYCPQIGFLRFSLGGCVLEKKLDCLCQDTDS